MKKKILAICLVVALAATAVVGATLAYFTDTKEATNTFTVGSVKIELIESQLHRENAGNGTTSPLYTGGISLNGDNSNIPYKSNSFCFSDEQIETDAEGYQRWLAENNTLMPGQYVRKNPYVKNTGNNDAYVRVHVLCPVGNGDTLDMVNIMSTQTALNKGEFTKSTSRVTIDGVLFDDMVFTRIDPLPAGEMTYWNVIGAVGLNSAVTMDMLNKLVEVKVLSKTNDGGYELNIKVYAEAIQADGFADATAAFAAFDAA